MPTSYRRDIDGLRASAVLAVVLFHAFPNNLPGGFIGVDIFFVISGYLITKIILSDLEKNTFSAASFYARRIRRIFPALILVLIVTFALGWHLLLPAEFLSLSKNIAAGGLFASNLMLLSEVSYFDIASHSKPLLHLWSLGIEEQFYLAWPLLLWLIPRRYILAAIVAMIAGSFVLNVAMISDHPSAVFYLPFTRAWELLAGAFLTFVPRQPKKSAEALGVIGSTTIVSSFFLFNSTTPFPGWAAVLPVVGTCMMIMSEGSIVSRFALSNPIAVKLGLISYPLYLWHWPLLVFADLYKFARPLTDIQRIAVVAGAFLLAWITYKLLEQPIRKSGFVFVKPLAASMAVLAVAAALAPLAGFVPKFPDAIAQLIAPPPNGDGWRVGECTLVDSEPDFPPSCADRNRPLIAIWGDSTASALVPGFRNASTISEFGIAQYTVSSCPPLLVKLPNMTPLCVELNHKIVAHLGTLAPDIVLLHAFWGSNSEIEDLRPTIEVLRAKQVRRIVILGPVPFWYRGLPQVVANHFWRTGNVVAERIPSNFFRPVASDDALRKVAADLNVEYISARDVFCNNDGCIARIGKSLVASDIVHLTRAGSTFLINAIFPRLHLTGM